ncbi:DUF4044 domain-containing protein [Agrilactobacillus yilanensis]|uniref:DUF4044 domain-containing protein n=1 Tax=Agrilactobacillus yilanensis TaxID=2485997 RepID=A0ABW4J411_9LACO|nr:DUF4044 domain-containing protein [Agrilactobacillus yilanensis]
MKKEKKQEKSTFSKITKGVIWAMLIIMLGSVIISAAVQLMSS